MLSLRILGRFGLTGPEGPVALPSAKLDALLAYLALALDPVPRDELRTLLWGSHFDAQAHQNFRQALARLRKALGSDVLISDEQGVRLSEMAVRCDAREFQALVASSDQAALREGVGLLAGELLAGIEIKEPAWEDWLETERRRLSAMACDAMERLAHIDLDESRPLDALRAAEECIRRDPYRESAHRLAMRAQIRLGRRSEALAHYQSLVQRLKQDLGAAPEQETANIYQAARGTAPVIDRRPADRNPSIVVLPFINHGGDADQDYFTDGIVEEITTALSRLRWLFVIACNTSFTYKGRAVDVKQVGLELGVQYVLEGGVRRAGGRLRITAQLVDTETARTLWADRFEGAVGDVFDLQDQVTSKVVAAIGPKVESVEIERSNRKPTASLDAYDHYLRGLAEVHRWNRQANQEALRQFYRSIELDRKFAAAYGMAARCFSQRKASGWTEDEAQEVAETEGLAHMAVEFGRDDPIALATSGIALAFVVGKVSEGNSLIDRALFLNPNFAWGWLFSGWVHAWSGDAEEAISRVTRAINFSPNDPHLYSMRRAIGFAHFIAGRYGPAIAESNLDTTSLQNEFIAVATAAASAGQLHEMEVGRAALTRLLTLVPGLNVSNLRRFFPIQRDVDYTRWEAGLTLVGLPK